MICIGRSNYFRFNHPEEAERMKTILPNSARISSVPMHFQQHNGHGHNHQEPPGTLSRKIKFLHIIHSCHVFSFKGMDNPEYFHMAAASAFQPVRSSSPQYIGMCLPMRICDTKTSD